MKNLKQKQAKVLQETLEYYKQDPQAKRCKEGKTCAYSPYTVGKQDTSEGCAVGRLLTPELQQRLDKENEGDIVELVFHKLPEEVQSLGLDFLLYLQYFHDSDLYWNAEGLTKKGEQKYKRLMEKVEMGYFEC